MTALRDFDGTVGSIVPPVFDAYARVFHPAGRGSRSGGDQGDVRWAEVAAANGRVMHPAAEWGSLIGSWHFVYPEYPVELWDMEPSTGQLPNSASVRLAADLSRHTAEPDQTNFAVWEGWGRGISAFAFPRGTPEDERRRTEEADKAKCDAWYGLLDSAATFQVPGRGVAVFAARTARGNRGLL